MKSIRFPENDSKLAVSEKGDVSKLAYSNCDIV